MSFPVVWLMPDVPREHNDSRFRLTWAQAQVEEILSDAGGVHLVGFDELGADETGAVVVVPAEYYTSQWEWLRNQVDNLDWAVVLLTSDERSTYRHHTLQHRLERLRVWVQTPRPGVHDGDRFLPFGPPPGTRSVLAEVSEPGRVRDLDWFFSGQVNHRRREELAFALRGCPNGKVQKTEGFSRGFAQRQYLEFLSRAKVAPCPSGPATPDSFRVWEALEAGCLPVVDAGCPGFASSGFWKLLLGQDPPFPVVNDWAEFPGLLESLLVSWPANANRAQAWWQLYRRELARRIRTDVEEMSQDRNAAGVTFLEAPALEGSDALPITVLIPTSPIPSHPDTKLIEETVESVRHHLPDAEIVVMCDGVRAEQEDRRADYDEYVRRVLGLAQFRWANVVPLVSDDHQHQANMTRRALTMVDTPLVLFVEHDTPLVTDEPIDWPAVTAALLADELDVIRFHHEAHVLDCHEYLMLDQTPRTIAGCPVLRTTQYSQRPHVARVDYYRRLIEDWFPPTCRTMIEDLAYSVCQRYPWRFNRLALYAPGGNMKRSLHSDGREGAEKFEMVMG